MREHPIPQDVTGYKFHIVGNMTLKQFAEIAGGVVVAIIFYSTNLPVVVKYPLAFMAFMSGFAIAFVPFEERTLDHWIATFIKILYKPTKFFWTRTPKIPDAFLYTQDDDTNSMVNEVDLSPARKQRIHEYLNSIQEDKSPYDWTDEEESRFSSILYSFQTVQVSDVSVTKGVSKPNLDVRVRHLNIPQGQQALNSSMYLDPSMMSTNTATTPQIVDQNYPEAQTQYVDQQKQLQTNEVAQEIAIPEEEQVHVEHTIDPENQAGELMQSAVNQDSSFVENEHYGEKQDLSLSAQEASHNVDLPFPTKPSEPNKLVGMVLTPDNKLITDAIIDIRDRSGNIVRAVKTNMLGQFFVTTPLENGEYYLDVEAQGKTFTTYEIKLKGKPVDPLEIRSN